MPQPNDRTNANNARNSVRAVAVVPSDQTIVGCSAITVGVAGNLAYIPLEDRTGTVVTLPVIAGDHSIACHKIMAATTATGIVAHY